MLMTLLSLKFIGKIMNAAARLELFLYDTEKIKVESDDPQSAILFHYPPELTDKQVLTHAGHFAALYLASHAFTAFSASVKPNFSPMTIKLTKGGHCEILPWQEGRKLIIIFQRPLTSKLCLIDENAQNGDFDENEESDGFCSILKNDIEMGLQRISSQITDLDLIIWFGGFCKTFLENPGISHPSLHNVKSAFHQIQRLFQALRPVHQWTIYGSVMQRCHSSSLKDKEVALITLLGDLPPRQPCHGGKKMLKSGMTLANVNDWQSVPKIPCSECHQGLALDSIADLIRSQFIKNEALKESSKDCLTLYLQKNGNFTYGMIMKSCQEDISITLLETLWTTVISKIMCLVDDDKRSESGCSSSMRPRRKKKFSFSN